MPRFGSHQLHRLDRLVARAVQERRENLIFSNCTGSAATVLETFKTKFITWKTDEVGQGAEDFLLYHKFGHVSFTLSEKPY